MDFVVDLPKSKGRDNTMYSSVLVVVDRMTKQVHIFPCNDLSSRHTVYLFYKECFRIYGLPDSIISDRGTHFTAEFWRWLCKLLGVDHRLSSAYHPQTDGQKERMNARIEQYLRVYGLHLRSGSELFSPLSGPPVPASVSFERLDADKLVRNAKKVEQFLIENIKYHSAEQEEQANKKRMAARNFKPGDFVWLNYQNFKTLRPCRKLDFKKRGPFKIIEAVGNYVFKLELPQSARIHPVFHVSLLSPVATDPLPGQTSGPLPALDAKDDDLEYEIEKIIGSHWQNGELYYLVRWKGYGPEDDWSIPVTASQPRVFL
ncbi:hypothetical protein K3495_g14923 [Podosphaera aphanis]|nr:hypothetical protein K3495_g14923 [Podosphaera aphanis]